MSSKIRKVLRFFRRAVVLDNGLFVENVFGNLRGLKILRARQINTQTVFRSDIVYIPFHFNQDTLTALRPTLEKFVKQGGLLVILGAVGDFGNRWCPFFQIVTEPEYPRSVLFEIPDGESAETDRLILQQLTESTQLQYHGIYVSHGTISGDKQDFEETILVRDAERKHLPVLAVYRWPKGGTYLLTTLDPDHHSCSGVPGPRLATENARRLRDNIVEWAESEWNRLPVGRIIWKKLRFLLYDLVRKTLTVALYLSAVALVVYWLIVKGESGTGQVHWYILMIGGLGVFKLFIDLIDWVLRKTGLRAKL